MIDLDARLRGFHRERIPSDLERVLEMPRVSSSPCELAASKWTERLAKSSAFRLRPVQGKTLDVLETFGGGFGAIGVGHGKTLIALLAGTAAGASRPVIFAPPALVRQMNDELIKWSDHFYITAPPVVVSYGKLSTDRSILSELAPDLIIADEAHYLRHKTSTRTRRFLDYFKRNPRCGFLALSGTITTKSLMDYAHLLEIALRDRAPIPLNRWELERWAACIDPDGEPNAGDLIRLGHLVEWSRPGRINISTPSTIRHAFRERLTTTPGVITTTGSSCDASLYLREHRPGHSEAVAREIKRLKTRWETPDGEPVADASTTSRVFKNLCLGFYYRWKWPNGAPDLVWLEAKRNLDRLIGRVLRYHSRPDRDSPALVVEWLKNGGGNAELRAAFATWQREAHKPAPEVETVWICSEKMKYAIEWVKNQPDPVVLWYRSRAVGEFLAAHGFGVHGPGSNPPTGATCAASITVHGKGRNLQNYARSFIIEPPANGGTFEQLLGRTHRAGQVSDEVWWDLFSFGDALTKARSHAKYIEETQGTTQKLNIATFLTPDNSPQKQTGRKPKKTSE